MRHCLDLRKMILDDSATYATSQLAKDALKHLVSWMQKRDPSVIQLVPGTGHAAPIESDIPSHAVVQQQFEELCKRLRDAFKHAKFRSKWEGVSGIVIMEDVFTLRDIYAGCQDYLYIFQHMACKTMNEAVVEGMGGECGTGVHSPGGTSTSKLLRNRQPRSCCRLVWAAAISPSCQAVCEPRLVPLLWWWAR